MFDDGMQDQPAAGLQAMQALQLDMDGLSYNEYFEKIEEISADLEGHWKSGQRVKALKVAIQLSKLLADSEQIKLYAKKHKMITETLDNFGLLVYNRMHKLLNTPATFTSGPPDNRETLATVNLNINVDDYATASGREFAKETCRNWFLKVASIRELVPRYYTELAILKACDILLKSHSRTVASIEVHFYTQSLKRLTRVAWGFGDPIVALHARAYLCAVSERLIGWETELSQTNLFDLLVTNLRCCAALIHHLDTHAIIHTLNIRGVDLSAYFDLTSRPVEAILNLISMRCETFYLDKEGDRDKCSMRCEGGNNTCEGAVEKKGSAVVKGEHKQITSDECVRRARDRVVGALQCLLGEIHQRGCRSFATNALLYSALRSMPNEIITQHSKELLDILVATYELWSGSLKDQCTIDDIHLATTFYSTLGNLLSSLDGDEQFGASTSLEFRTNVTKSASAILEDLHEKQQKPSKGGQNNNAPTLHYLRCFKSLITFASNHTPEQVEPLLHDFVVKIEKDRQCSSQYQVLLDIIKALLTNESTLSSFKRVSGSQSFGQLLNLLRKDEHKLDASRWILETMRANIKLNYKNAPVQIVDRVTINFTLKCIATINGSLNVLTALDDFEHLAHLVIFFIDLPKIEDFREKLEFYTRCRSSVGNLNLALEHLIKLVLQLPNEHRRVEKKRSIRQNYLNGCLAYAFITIPAVQNPCSRIELFALGGRIALHSMSLSLADQYMRQLILELAKQTRVIFETTGPSAEEQREIETIATSTATFSGIKQSPHANESTHIKSSPTKSVNQLRRHVENALTLVIQFQEYIDLKHKLAISNLIKSSFDECSDLLETLRKLNCIDNTGVGAADASLQIESNN